MNPRQLEIIARTETFVQKTLPHDATGHDWQHVFRVRRNALHIATAEGADLFLVHLAALLHDIADWKFHAGDEAAGPRTARAWLVSLDAPQEAIEEVVQIVERLSFKGADVPPEPLSLAGQCVQDADRLDALGAIGIARAFAYGGHKGRSLYDPAIPPERHTSFEQYRKNSGPTLNHFYEKLLLLRDRFCTATGRSMAVERQAFLEEFLSRFLAEWHNDA